MKDGETILTEESIIQYCKEKLASYKIPEVVFVEELPKNALGKVLKRIKGCSSCEIKILLNDEESVMHKNMTGFCLSKT